MTRGSFDDSFGHYNDQHSHAAKGPMTGHVIPGSQDIKTHRVDVSIPHFGVVMRRIRVSTPWSAGAGTGIHALPHDNAEVKVEMKHGKSSGFGQAEVTGVMNSEGDFPTLSHPALANQRNFFAIQGRSGQGDSFTPGSIQFWDEQGGKHNLIVGKETHHAQGATDSRHKGMSMTEPEQHGLFSSNSLARAANMAAKLDVSNMNSLANGFAAVGKQVRQAEAATTSTALTHARQTMGQADTVAIGGGAAGLAAGTLPEGM